MPDLNNIEYLEGPVYEVPRGEALRSMENIDFLGVEPDSTVPVITVVSPPVGSAIATGASLVIDVTDNLGLLLDVLIHASFPSLPATEIVHDGSGFSTAYSSSSKVAITNGFRFTLRRNVGWPSSPTIVVKATDTSGSQATGSYSWVAGSDTPTVTVVSPAPGSTITPATPIVADVVDNIALRRVMLFAAFDDYVVKEVVFDGSTFSMNYSLSSRTPITNGYRYTLLRDGGWPSRLTLTVNAIDTTGNEA